MALSSISSIILKKNLRKKTSKMKGKEFNKAEVFNLEHSIEYAKDAVVSRTVINRPEATITLFAFDQGQGLSEHSTPFDAQVQILDGTVKILIDGKPSEVNKGEIIILPANIPHALEAVSSFKMLLTMIKNKV